MAVAAGVKGAIAAWQHTALVEELKECGGSEVFYSVPEFRKHLLEE